MKKQNKGIPQERCVKYCSQQVQSISAEIADLKLDEYEKELRLKEITDGVIAVADGLSDEKAKKRLKNLVER